MMHEAPKFAEGTRLPESIVITPESLSADNGSDRAKALSAKWEENSRKNKLWGIVTCGDARIMTPRPDKLISVRSIAAAGTVEKRVLGDESVELIIVMSHVDGDTIENGKRPKGCGGLGAKEEALNGNHEKATEGIQYYIDNAIEHPDPVIQALISAREIRNATGKPSLAVIQNHRTGKVYPFAALLKGYDIISSDLDLFKSYSEAEIYANGIPTLNELAIPEVFREFMDASKEYVSAMLRAYPNLKDMQRIQNPRMVVLSSKLPSIRIRYPEIADFPGLVFKLFLSREKERTTGRIDITPEAQKEVMAQAQYPLVQAVRNFGKPDLPFSKTDRVLIETSAISVSKKLAGELAGKPWMKDWLALPDHQILVVQNQEGISNIIELFTPQTT